MQLARAFDLVELGLDLGEALLDHAPVGFELGFAWPAKEAEAAALALEMGPGAHQPAPLIGQMRMLDLQRAFARARTSSEDLENEAGAVEHLGVPGLLQIALLHRRERAVHDDDAGFERFDDPGELLDLAFAEIGRGPHRAEHDDTGLTDVEIDGPGQPDRLIKPRRRRTVAYRRAGRRAPQHRLDDQRTAGCRARRAQPVRGRVAAAGLQSGLFPSRRIFGALEKLDGMTRHDGRNGVLVDELRVSVAPQQHAEIIEPGHHALQLDAVHQEDGERDLVLADVIEKRVLQVLRAVGSHGRCFRFCTAGPCPAGLFLTSSR